MYILGTKSGLLNSNFVQLPRVCLTFIDYMANIPLALVLFGQGVSFAGGMAFIFGDLVVFTLIRVQARY